MLFAVIRRQVLLINILPIFKKLLFFMTLKLLKI